MTDQPDLTAPRLHVRPSTGWLNDPNGIGFWDGRWHVMFQWNPYSPTHTAIHWGHLSSPDLLSWREEPTALAPRPGAIDQFGVWSGVAVVERRAGSTDGEGEDVTLVYTACRDSAGDSGVALARPAPEGHFVPGDDWVAPHPSDWQDVRDPFLLEIEGTHYAVQGAGRPGADRPAGGGGAVLVFRVPELDGEWELLGELAAAPLLGEGIPRDGAVWECPQLVRVGADWVLVVSWYDEHQVQGVTAYVGSVEIDDDGVPRFLARSGAPLDSGPDFYAPQLVVDGDRDRVLAWGWAWEGRGIGDRVEAVVGQDGALGVVDPATNLTTQEEIAARGWAGTLTFPREVTVVDGAARLVPARELAGLRGDALDLARAGEVWTLTTSESAFGARVPTSLGWELTLAGTDDSRVVWHGAGGAGDVTVLVDGSIVEIYDATGSHTRRAYAQAGEAWVLRVTGAEDSAAGATPEAWVLAAP